MDNRTPPHTQTATLPEVARLIRHRRVLETLLEIPGQQFTIRELSLQSRTPYATTWRLVEALSALGVLRVQRVGASRVLSVNATSPLLPELRRLAALRLRPHWEAAHRFARLAARVQGVRKVVLFGSASRGQAGLGSDVDVAVVLDRRTEAAMEPIYRIAAKVQDETGLKVVPVGLTSRELRGDTRFARGVRSGEVMYDRS